MIDTRVREQAAILAFLGLLVGALAALQLGSSEPGLLYLAPAILLLAALACGRYPGQRLVAALARAWHPLRRSEGREPTRSLAPPRSSPRGGVLLAMALAGRGPPS